MGDEGDKWEDQHEVILTIAWFGFENVILWSTLLKHYKYGIYLHALFGSAAAGLMVVGSLMMIVSEGFGSVTQQFLHMTLGFVLLVVMPAILFSGAACKIQQQSSSIDPKRVYIGNWGHSIFGWLVIILSKIPLYASRDADEMVGFLIPDIISHVLFLVVKILILKKMQGISVKPDLGELALRKISCQKDLKIYSQNYFIFADYVYPIDPVLGTHPGGWKIIEKIRCREVDRFIYGMEPLQVFDHVARVSHTARSMNLAGEPLAKLSNTPVYHHLRELSEAKIESTSCHDEARRIYTVYLTSTGIPFEYKGYSQLSQIGQYYAVTINGRKTRLYTMVNFLQPRSMKLLDEVSGGKISLAPKKVQMAEVNQEISLSTLQNHEKDTIPLLIKIYDDGEFTPSFLAPNFDGSVTISQSRGRGLALHDIGKGRIVMMAGGTGLYPFSDSIDLLYKDFLVSSGTSFSNAVKTMDPLSGQNAFKQFSFSLYIAVNSLEELHPITLFECNELAKAGKMKCYAKLKNFEKKTMQEKYPNIAVIDQRFEQVVKDEIKGEETPHFFMCGPTRFSKRLVETMQELEVDPENYHIV